MSDTRVGTIRAQYRFIDGYHIFTSEDVRGLYVASKDAKSAFDNVCPILQELVSRKLKIACEIEPAMTFDEFMADVEVRQAIPDFPALGNREFIVRRAAA